MSSFEWDSGSIALFFMRGERLVSRANELPRKATQRWGPIVKTRLFELSPKRSAHGFATKWHYRTRFYKFGDESGAEVAWYNLDEKAGLLFAGSPPHMIFPVRTKALRFRDSDGELIFTKKVSHPGFKPLDILERLEEDSGLRNQMLDIFDDEAARAFRE